MVLFSISLLSAAFGAMAWLALLMISGILSLSFLYSLLCGLLLRRRRWLVWLPIPVAAVGLALCLILCPLDPAVFCVLWGLVALTALCGAVLGVLTRKIILYITGWIRSDPASNPNREEDAQCAAAIPEEIRE